MGAQDSRIAIELYVDDKGTVKIKQFASESEASFHRVEQAGTRSASLISEGWTELSAVIGPAMAAYFSAQAAKDVVMMADNYTLLDSRLGLITKTSSELSTVQGELFRISQETGTAYTTNAGTVSKLGLALKDTNTDSRELLAINELVNKSLIVSGATTAEQSSFLLQFSQAMGSGVLQGEEFRAMMESNSYFGGQLAKALNTNIAGLRQMSKDGKLTSDVLRAAFPAMAAEINVAFDKMPITIGRAMTMVENSFGKVINETNKAADGTSGVANAIKELAQTIEQNKASLGDLFTGMVDGASELVKGIVRIGELFAGWEAVKEGNLKFWDYMNMGAEEQHEWLKKNNAEGKNQSFAQLNREAAEQVAFQRAINEDIKKRAAGIGELTEAQKRHNAEVEKELASHIKLTEEQTKQAEKILAAEKKKAEDIAKAQEEMFKETGLMAEQHYAAEQEKLTRKAASWKAADGDIVDIENWLYDQLGKLEEEADSKGATSAAAAMDRAQGNYRVLIDQLAAATQSTTDHVGLIHQQIKGLDGETFTIHANLDGSGFENTINVLIDKFRVLASAASTTNAAAGGAATWDNGSYNSFEVGGGDQLPQGKSLTTNKTSTTININQKLSRSDVTSILGEQRRIEARR